MIQAAEKLGKTARFRHAQAVYQQRQQVLRAAYVAHPERFVRGLPTPPELPTAVWNTGVYLTLEQPERALPLDTKFRIELSHNA
jgi:hypothetical protein